MNDLPESWEVSTVGEIASVQLGRQRSPKNHTGPHMRPYLRSANVTWRGIDTSDVKEMNFDPDEAATFELRHGDILLNEASGSPGEVGKPAIWRNEIPGTCFQNTLLRVRSAQLDEGYLYWYFYNTAFTGRFGEAGRGVNIRHLGKQGLAGFPIPVPPLPEQRRIVDAIEEHFSRLDAAEASISAASKALDPLLAEVTKRLVLDSGTLEKTPVAGQPAVAAGWEWMRLDDLGELGRGKSKHRPRNDPSLYGGSYPFVQTGDVARADGRLRSHSQTYNERGLAQSRLWPPGTVVITIAANIAESAVLDFEACFPDSVVGLVPNDAIVRPEWVEFFIRTAKANLERYAPATAQKNINLQVLREVVVPVPPLTVQDSLLALLSSIESTIAHSSHTADGALSRSAALRRAILAAAFSGRLLPQDPADEPASVMLRRIAEERTATKAPRRNMKAAT